MNVVKTCLILAILVSPLIISGQSEEDQPKVELNGYLKFLNTTSLVDGLNGGLIDNLIHNRLNLKWYLHPKWTFTGELRNRIFWGDTYQLNPFFSDQLELSAKDYLDLSTVIFEGGSFIGHSALDRAYLEYSDEKWNIRIGRQRVNWGINLVWNPNDVFNAYNFVDFDYEERPGSDAIRIQYNYNYASSLELVYNPSRISNQQSLVGLWRTNRWNYDFQFLFGKSDRDFVLGGGWAGNIGLWGFKGEWVYANNLDDQPNAFSATIGLDYAFENGTYTSFGYLFNDQADPNATFAELFNLQLSYKNLFPYRHAIFDQWMFQISPLMNAGLSVIYAPGSDNLLFLNPFFVVSLTQDIDMDIIGQIVMVEGLENYHSPLQAIYARFKYSF